MAGRASDEDVAKALAELLTIAKLAMPDFLYEKDPRVHFARALLANVKQVSDLQAPSMVGTPTTALIDSWHRDSPSRPIRRSVADRKGVADLERLSKGGTCGLQLELELEGDHGG